MNDGGIPLLQLAERRLAWADARQRLLAENVANADTPGWQPRDLAPFAAGLTHASLPLERTDPQHLAPTEAQQTSPQAHRTERAPDGNAVSLDVQLANIAETETAHDLTLDLYKKYLSLFRLAIGH
jgi:flagellar basal-body rod protein FlgB